MNEVSDGSRLQELFADFLGSADSLRVYHGDSLVFCSEKDGLLPLLEYATTVSRDYTGVVVFDKVVGRAAALLCIKVGSRAVYSPLGSELAARVLDEYGVKYRLERLVPFITAADGSDMCPMERLSLDKEPEEFYQVLVRAFPGQGAN
jgi:hypothetical protein